MKWLLHESWGVMCARVFEGSASPGGTKIRPCRGLLLRMRCHCIEFPLGAIYCGVTGISTTEAAMQKFTIYQMAARLWIPSEAHPISRIRSVPILRLTLLSFVLGRLVSVTCRGCWRWFWCSSCKVHGPQRSIDRSPLGTALCGDLPSEVHIVVDPWWPFETVASFDNCGTICQEIARLFGSAHGYHANQCVEAQHPILMLDLVWL